MKTESIVKKRYADGANAQEAALCCPVEYDPQYLKVIPAEVIERDYGCGDPSQYLKAGETVLDLGSGTGKICFIASQVVGPEGKVIGVDMTDDMLDVARRNAPLVAEKIGYANVEFCKGRIQDLALDLEELDRELQAQPIDNANRFLEAEELAEEIRVKKTMIPNDSVDVVVSNCVLNLVSMNHRLQLFEEIFRVLKVGGRAVISDIVSDETVNEDMMKDPDLWSGCISGAFREDEFLQAFEEAGFYGVQILKLDKEPWQTVQGIEFRSMTIEAFKGKQGACLDHKQAVIYKGPFKMVLDDDDHPMERGQRYAVCDKTFQLYRKAPYAEFFEFIEPREEVPADQAEAFDCNEMYLRHPRETKGENYDASTDASECCGSGSDCC
ncbi:MAG: methyltransferase domain-containing protein [Verrucomicrobiota bacterium]